MSNREDEAPETEGTESGTRGGPGGTRGGREDEGNESEGAETGSRSGDAGTKGTGSAG